MRNYVQSWYLRYVQLLPVALCSALPTAQRATHSRSAGGAQGPVALPQHHTMGNVCGCAGRPPSSPRAGLHPARRAETLVAQTDKAWYDVRESDWFKRALECAGGELDLSGESTCLAACALLGLRLCFRLHAFR